MISNLLSWPIDCVSWNILFFKFGHEAFLNRLLDLLVQLLSVNHRKTTFLRFDFYRVLENLRLRFMCICISQPLRHKADEFLCIVIFISVLLFFSVLLAHYLHHLFYFFVCLAVDRDLMLLQVDSFVEHIFVKSWTHAKVTVKSQIKSLNGITYILRNSLSAISLLRSLIYWGDRAPPKASLLAWRYIARS